MAGGSLACSACSLNWFGDSLDGTWRACGSSSGRAMAITSTTSSTLPEPPCYLAAWRRPGYMSPGQSALSWRRDFLVSAETYLATHARGVFTMAFLGVGPTELRMLMAAGAIASSPRHRSTSFGKPADPAVGPRRRDWRDRHGRHVRDRVHTDRPDALPRALNSEERNGARFTRFAVAGTGGFVVQIAMLALLVPRAGASTTWSPPTMSVEVAILTNFVWHERWTWHDAKGRG